MQKRYWIICGLFTFLGRVWAAPMDDPDTVYIEGKPCGSFCQQFFDPAVVSAAKPKEIRPAPRKAHQAEQRIPAKLVANRRGHNRTAAMVLVPEVSPPQMTPSQPEPRPSQPEQLPIINLPQNIVPQNEPLQIDQAAATAAHLTENARQNVLVTKRSLATGSDAELTGSIPWNDPRIVLVITKNDVQEIADLAQKSVGVDNNRLQVDAAIRIALVAAGAPGVEISEEPTNAIERLKRGEVPAAVLGLVSRDAAEAFPNIDGYRLFRVPLSPL